MLCGISTSFPVLFPIQRQVAHALLTRPPLTFQEQAPESSVRLECVRHAASVHPEPGSNSQNIVFIPTVVGLIHILSKFAVLLFLLLIYSCLKELSRLFCLLHFSMFPFLLCFVLSLVVQFSRTVFATALLRQLDHYITYVTQCQAFF